MDDNKEKYTEVDEISLKELITTVLENWKLIAKITSAFLVIACLYLLVLAKPVYESSISGYINISNAVNEFGEYPFPAELPADYLTAFQSHDVLDLAIKKGAQVDNREYFAKTISLATEKNEKAKSFTINVEIGRAHV